MITKFNDSEADKIIKVILSEKKIKIEDFDIKGISELKAGGTERKTLLVPEDIQLVSIEDDDHNEGKIKATISFSLPSGSYATIITEEIIK